MGLPVTFTLSELRFRPYSLPFASPFATSRETLTVRRGWVVWAGDGEGGWGVGEAAPLAGFGMESHEEAGRVLAGWAASLPGREVAIPTAGAEGMPPVLGLGEGLEAPAARHGLELALLDLAARRAGLPLARTLHPRAAAQVPVNAVLGAGPVEETVLQALALTSQGYRTLKLKVGGASAGEDLERVRAVREAVGGGVGLRVDANESWQATEAPSMLEALAPLDIEYVEQPLPADDLQGMARLVRISPIPIAADEAVVTLEKARAVLDREAAHLLILKPMALGGILSALAVARLAAERGVRTVITTMLDGAFARAGAAAAAAALGPISGDGGAGIAHGLATGELLAEDLVPDPPLPRGGRLALSTAPGLGIAAAPPPPGR